jgi:hypothetical protein
VANEAAKQTVRTKHLHYVFRNWYHYVIFTLRNSTKGISPPLATDRSVFKYTSYCLTPQLHLNSSSSRYGLTGLDRIGSDRTSRSDDAWKLARWMQFATGRRTGPIKLWKEMVRYGRLGTVAGGCGWKQRQNLPSSSLFGPALQRAADRGVPYLQVHPRRPRTATHVGTLIADACYRGKILSKSYIQWNLR